MNKKAKNKTKFMPEIDSRRRTNVLLEEIRSEVRTVAEGHGGIVNRLGNIESELNSVKTAVMDTNLRVKGLEDKFEFATANHEKRLQKLEAA